MRIPVLRGWGSSTVIWIGGLFELIAGGSWEFLVILVALAVMLLVFSFIFTVRPASSPDWFEAEERIED